MSALKVIAVVLVILISGVLTVAGTKPDVFSVARSVTIQAPPERVFALINDFHLWPNWSPWERLDPAMKRSYSGSERGKGAVYAWEGTSKVGAGRMEITESNSPSQLKIALDFVKPIESRSQAEYRLRPDGTGTRITWEMHGPNSFGAKIVQVFFDTETMVGKDFETGLANLKQAAEH